MKLTSLLITGFVSFLSANAVTISPVTAFGNCPGNDYHDEGNHRCLYGTCDGKCHFGKKYHPVLDSRVNICMYCEPGYVFNKDTRKCEKNKSQ